METQTTKEMFKNYSRTYESNLSYKDFKDIISEFNKEIFKENSKNEKFPNQNFNPTLFGS